MENPWSEFILSLDQFKDTEYGDFKREMDAHLRRLVETAPAINEKQAREIVKIRKEYLWSDHDDDEIESIKRRLRKKIREIQELN